MKKVFYVITAIIALTLSSCLVTRTTVGEGPTGKGGHKKVYSKTKQVYLFWGFMSLGNSQPSVPKHGNVQVKTSYNVVDAFVSGLTAGLFSMQTIKILVKKEDIIKYENIANKNIGSGKKVIFKSSNQQVTGEVLSIDNTKGKAKVKYINDYGEEEYKDKKYDDLNVISDEDFNKARANQDIEIQKHKFSNNEKVTWIKSNEISFGTIIMMDDKTHDATVEFLNVFHEKKSSRIDYLKLSKVTDKRFSELLKLHEEKEKKYKFTVGEKVRYKTLTGEREGEILSLNDTAHKATIQYLNKKNEKKTVSVGYLNVFKK